MSESEVQSAYGYVDTNGRIRSITMSRTDAIRNARLNGVRNIVHLRLTVSGTVACTGPSPITGWEDYTTGARF